ncbi:MAG TPA: efflux RND transporter permease subunit [Verrucomicrobiae bacterium]|jgi:multidrug efflux pump subunit AcrB|nr:efflux RND transporter permease subunit [Verrucomicrobiae bacterium]
MRRFAVLLPAVALSLPCALATVVTTSLTMLIGLTPMALKLGTGREAYAPLAQAIIGGLAVLVVLTVFIVSATYLLVYRQDDVRRAAGRKDNPAQ